MYDYGSYGDYGTTSSGVDAAAGIAGGIIIVMLLVSLAVCVLQVIAQWKIFEKAGRPGWHSLIPIYNMWSLFEIVGMKGWYVLAMFIPMVGSIIYMVLYIMFVFKLATAFGKDMAFGFGLLFLGPIFMLILGFSKNVSYVGIPAMNVPGQGNGVPQYGNPYVDPVPNPMGPTVDPTMNANQVNNNMGPAPTQPNVGPQDPNNGNNMPL
jgi:hypothetical protein